MSEYELFETNDASNIVHALGEIRDAIKANTRATEAVALAVLASAHEEASPASNKERISFLNAAIDRLGLGAKDEP